MALPRLHVGFPLLVLSEGPQVPFQPWEAELRVLLVQLELAHAPGLLASAVVVFDLHLRGPEGALFGHVDRVQRLGPRRARCD